MVARSANRPTGDLTAYDAYLRADAMLHTSGNLIPRALPCWRRQSPAVLIFPVTLPFAGWTTILPGLQRAGIFARIERR